MEGAALVAKMNVHSVQDCRTTEGKVSEQVEANAVYGDTDENKVWAKYTPSGSLKLQIDNPAAFGKVQPGEYLVYLVPCPKGE